MTNAKLLTLALVFCLLAARLAAAESSHPVDRLKPGHWLEVAGSRMIDVAFKWPKGLKHGGIVGIMYSWSGGTYDTKRDRLIIWGGGHGNYAGNEVYVFDVKSLKWQRLNDPTLKVDREAKLDQTGVYSDGKPRSLHTRDYLQYVPSIDRFCVLGISSPWPLSRRVFKKHQMTWAFDLEAKKWEKKSRPPFHMTASGWDPIAGLVWGRARSDARIACWDPLKDAWKVRGRATYRNSAAFRGIVDPVGRRFFAIGGKNFYSYNVAEAGTISEEKIKSTGPQDIVNVRLGPAVEYDPVLDKLVCWHGGAGIFTMNLSKMAWKKVAPAGSKKVVPTAPTKNGTYGRWQYVPSKNAYMLVNHVKESVYFYRLSRRAEQPVPKRFVAAMKKKDAALVKWVAGQVALWPKAKSEPVLKAALSAQSGAAAEAIKKALKEVK